MLMTLLWVNVGLPFQFASLAHAGKRTATEASPVILQGISITIFHAFQIVQLYAMCVWEIYIYATAQV